MLGTSLGHEKLLARDRSTFNTKSYSISLMAADLSSTSGRQRAPGDRRSNGGPIRRSGIVPGPSRQNNRGENRLFKCQKISMTTAFSLADVGRPSVRPQPYQVPAGRSLDDEMTSILSDWSMSDDVKRILYGGNGAGDGNRLNRVSEIVQKLFFMNKVVFDQVWM